MADRAPVADWRALLEHRVREAEERLGPVSGVRGLVLGGSIGRGEPWPLSDIDLIPIVTPDADLDELERRRSGLVEWWTASGRAQSLDLSWLRFTDAEAARATASGAPFAAERMSDAELRWFHGFDKVYGGRGLADPDGLAEGLAVWATQRRFAPEVTGARIARWRAMAVEATHRARDHHRGGDLVEATLALREAARMVRMVLVESWGERLGSLGREWTLFERMADRHGEADLAARLAALAGADVDAVSERVQEAPVWLRTRIELAWQGRQAVGEAVTPEQNARDQIAAFSVLVPRRRPGVIEACYGVPTPEIELKLGQLDELIATVGR